MKIKMVDSATDGEWQTLEQGMPVGDQEIQCDIVTDPEYYCYHNLAEIQMKTCLRQACGQNEAFQPDT